MPETFEKPSLRAVLHSSTLLNALSEAELEELSQSSRLSHVARGEYIWLSGDEADFFGLVGRGFVKMVKGTPAGTDVTLELMGPGQIFGLLGTLDGKGCPLSAIAVTEVWYVKIPKRVFLPIYQKNVPLKDKLVRRLTRRFHDAHVLLARMSSGRVDERVAAILFLLSESYGERSGESITLQVPLTRQEIAEMAGTTVESTIRVLSRWQKEGLVSTDKHVITILDEPALGAILSG